MRFIISILKYSFQLALKNIKIILIAFILNLLTTVLFVLMLLRIVYGAKSFNFAHFSAVNFFVILLIIFVLTLTYLIVGNLINFFVILKTIGNEYKVKASNKSVIQYSLKRIYSVFTANTLAGLYIFLWSLLFVVPGIIAYIRYSLVTYYALIKGQSPKEALQSSNNATNGYKMKLSFIYIPIINKFATA